MRRSGTQAFPEKENAMKARRRAAVAALMIAGSVTVGAAPANAATTQVAGESYYDTSGQCPVIAAYSDSPPLVMTGDLTGCWYRHVQDDRTTASGFYFETGQELFVGSVNGGASGTFTAVYGFEAQYYSDGSEFRGRRQHPIVAGSGTGGLAGARGRIDFEDPVQNEPVTYVYRGQID
jgi:hypothetical protein